MDVTKPAKILHPSDPSDADFVDQFLGRVRVRVFSISVLKSTVLCTRATKTVQTIVWCNNSWT